MKNAFITNDGYIALLDAVYFKGLQIGNISEEGIDVTGEDAQTLEIWAAQRRSAPVKKMQTRDATVRVEGKMIELKPRNLQTLIGGTIDDNGRWDAPSNTMVEEGPLKILAGTGQTIEFPRASLLLANLRGGLGQDKTLGVQFAFERLQPGDLSTPMSIYPTEAFIKSETKTLSFDKAGGSKTIAVEASGPFAPGAVPDGFSISVEGGEIIITASENTTGSVRSGSIVFTLVADVSQKITITLTQSAA